MNNSTKIESVQMMRGIAAFMVVLAHIPIIENGGAAGVDLFFCVSGFIMMYVTEKGTEKFLIKRAIRIVPLYWLATIGMYIILLLFPSIAETSKAEPEYLVKSLLFIP